MSDLKRVIGVQVAGQAAEPLARVAGVQASAPAGLGRVRAVDVLLARGPKGADGAPGQDGDAATLERLTAADAKLAEMEAALADTAQARDEALAVTGINPAYISETTADPPAAPEGTRGAKRTSTGLLTRLLRTADAWAQAGSPILTLLGLQARSGTSVLDAGAAGDGVTDDSAAFRAALAGGGRVMVPDGKYVIAGVSLDVPGTTLALSREATLRLKDGANTYALRINAAGCAVEGGTLNGNKVHQSAQYLASVLVRGANCRVSNMTIHDAAWWGIHVQDCDGAQIVGNRISNPRNNAIYAQGYAAGTYRGLLIQGNTISIDDIESSHHGGIKCQCTTDGAFFERPRVIGNDVTLPHVPLADTDPVPGHLCIEVYGGSAALSRGWRGGTVASNTTQGGVMGISIDSSEGLAVTGNSVLRPSWGGIELASSHKSAVSGNVVDGGGACGRGIVLDGAGSTRNSISGNTVLAVTKVGIDVQPGANRNAVTGNTVDVSAATATGISVAGSHTSGAGNVLHGNGTAPLGLVIKNAQQVAFSATVLERFGTGLLLSADGAGSRVDMVTITGTIYDSNTTAAQSRSTANGGALGNSIRLTGELYQFGGLTDYRDYNNGRGTFYGLGSPEGVVTAGIGSTYVRNDGGAGSTLYVKESGSLTKTGWVAK